MRNHHVLVSAFWFIWIPTFMGLRTLEIFNFFQCGDRLYTSESDVYRFWRMKSIPALKGLKKHTFPSKHLTHKNAIFGEQRPRGTVIDPRPQRNIHIQCLQGRQYHLNTSHHPQGALLAQFSLYLYKGYPGSRFVKLIYNYKIQNYTSI